MLIVSDVHGAFAELARVGRSQQPLLVLGDLINYVDYRTGEGIAADVYGRQFAQEFTRNRRRGDWSANRQLWRQVQQGREREMAERIRSEVRRQYQEARRALSREGRTYLIHGNVDWPREMGEALSDVVVKADGRVVEIEGYSVGFAGGGVPTPARAKGEEPHEVMAEKLAGLGEVDILCTHVAPSVGPLHRDVVTGQPERSSQVVLEYLLTHRPRFHYFGDIHQPQATTWRVGKTLCRNVGYFRATARAVQHK
ncbi:MAG: metallophosphoesterase [Acidimicrobiia bacterium]|nr:metallophosphoesterase [bacterium]MCY3652666.1 metallophosphoesterase [bacterium]MXZ06054.1 metallophosphoesterase [Acidimicrobiia bacterium]MYH55998.1 metallophosphoesterase [Acidimicrobiia bacterium]